MNLIKKQLYEIFTQQIKNSLDTAMNDIMWENCEEIRIHNSGYLWIKIDNISFLLTEQHKLGNVSDKPYIFGKSTILDVIQNAIQDVWIAI